MHRELIEAWWPWFGLLAGSSLLVLLVVRVAGARFEPRRLLALHRDQAGAVQSLSFVLTLPLFVMLMLFIVQVSQLMIAAVVVQYAAYAAARAAIVWIPAAVGEEAPNWIGPSASQPTSAAIRMPTAQPEQWLPLAWPESHKLAKIAMAARWACVPISPSRSLGLPASADLTLIQEIAYRSLATNSTIPSAAITSRLRNKLAYAFAIGQTITLWNRSAGAWAIATQTQTTSVLVQHYVRSVDYTASPMEVGWQDPIGVTVTHYLALLPGPGNMLFRYLKLGSSEGLGNNFGYLSTPSGRVPVFRLTGAAVLMNEGQKSVVPYVYPLE
jgi:Flp pilus assembly protein TadG